MGNLVNIRITKLNVRQFYIFIETFAVSILIAYLKSSYLYLKNNTESYAYSTSWVRCLLYVTGFWKTDRNVTLGLFHFIGPANAYTHTLHIRTAIIRLG